MVGFNPMEGIEKATQRMNEFFSGLEKGVNVEVGGFQPKTDIIDDDKSITVIAELPGVAKEDVNVSVNEDRILTISGVKKKGESMGEMEYIRSERVFSDFKRSFALPDGADIEKISAKYDNGVLALTIPKIEPPAPKEIKVNIA